MATFRYLILLTTLCLLGIKTTSAQENNSSSVEGNEQSGRELPKPKSLITPLTDDEKAQTEAIYVPPEEKVQAAFEPPPQAKSISQRNLWVDLKQKRVYLDGFVTMREGPLEMFACPVGSKEHESIIATLAQPSEVHAALLAIGGRAGTPVQFLPDFVPATGQRIRVWICYRDPKGQFQVADAKTWVQNSKTKETLQTDWVFSGSGFWKDPNDGREYYRADGGDMICVSNFSTAMMDLPIASSAEANSLQFSPNTSAIPERGTAIRMVLAPIPIDTPVSSGSDSGKEEPSDETKPSLEPKGNQENAKKEPTANSQPGDKEIGLGPKPPTSEILPPAKKQATDN